MVSGKIAFVTGFAAVILIALPAWAAPVVWTGPTTTFTKVDGADWTQAANQDRITGNVWITRQNIRGLINFASESSYTHDASPADTEWASGSAADWASLTFQPWELWGDSIGQKPDIVGVPAVLHLITDDIYLDIQFTSWTSSAGGGGFAYERSTVPEPVSMSLLLLGGVYLLGRRRRS